ncbi:hypothetical protein ACTWP5_16930 [Streptomyces sp. 4N509B]|uniref:hypothetical protein n=1 Tax=Streptomyces sp. 4N509B TaxID=3457413 RepID=UPI003FD1BFE7
MPSALSPPALPAAGLVEVRVVAASPEAARQVAEALRDRFAATEQRSYPAGREGGGTRLHLTVDVAQAPGPLQPFPSREVTSHPHADEIQVPADEDPTVPSAAPSAVTFALGSVQVSRGPA